MKRRMIDGSIIFSIALSASYLILSPGIATPLYNGMLFYPDYPTRYDASRYEFKQLQGVAKEELYIPLSDGKKLHAWFFKHSAKEHGGKHPDRLVIVNHGNAGNISDRAGLADDLLQLGLSVLLYDYEGYGLSDGSPSIPKICRDGLAVYDYAHEKLGYSPDRVVLYGESLGCAVACEVSKQRPSCALILESGFSSLKTIAGEKLLLLRAYPTAFFPKPRLDNLAILQAPHPPLLLIHGELDTTVPASHSRYLFEKAAEPKRLTILPHSEHFVAEEDNEAFMAALRSFISSLDAQTHG
jgi:pimeloyl-ACP methyl ester carboxylesterase